MEKKVLVQYVFMGLRGSIRAFLNLRLLLIFVDKDVRISRWKNLEVGKRFRIFHGSTLSAGGKGIIVHDDVKIGRFSTVEVVMGSAKSNSKIELKSGVAIGDYCYLGGAGGLVIGENTITGQFVSFHPENHVWSIDRPGKKNGVTRLGIVIGQNCWIGAKVTILDGSTIGNNSIVAAGAVVKGEFPDNVLIAGVPAKVKRHLN